MNIDHLAERFTQAKEAHDDAKAAERPEGAVTTAGNLYKVTTTYRVNRTVDRATLDAVRDRVPPALLEQAIEYRPAIKLPGLRYLRNNEPDTYAVLAQAITATPGKPSVKVERVEAQQEAA